jgi:hypothetical protein
MFALGEQERLVEEVTFTLSLEGQRKKGAHQRQGEPQEQASHQ